MSGYYAAGRHLSFPACRSKQRPAGGQRLTKTAKTYGMFQYSQSADDAEQHAGVMFKETAAGMPPAVQAWLYPGETYGYEFAYPHAWRCGSPRRATSRCWPTTTDSPPHRARPTHDVDEGADARIDENDKPVSTDATLKEFAQRGCDQRPRRRRPSRPRPSPPHDLPDVICHGRRVRCRCSRC